MNHHADPACNANRKYGLCALPDVPRLTTPGRHAKRQSICRRSPRPDQGRDRTVADHNAVFGPVRHNEARTEPFPQMGPTAAPAANNADDMSKL
jgi:hypothetical protein